MIVIGVTGSIGMGKTTVAGMFADEGARVWNADAAVHRLYEPGGGAVAAIAERFPDAIVAGAVDRGRLAALVVGDAPALAELESIVHPIVAEDRAQFVTEAARDGVDFVVLDIPLLFEKGGEKFLDAVIVASAPADIQRARVLARPGMTEKKFRSILMKQTPDAEKRRRADYVINTGVTFDETRAEVRAVITDLRRRFDIV